MFVRSLTLVSWSYPPGRFDDEPKKNKKLQRLDSIPTTAAVYAIINILKTPLTRAFFIWDSPDPYTLELKI